ncbi:MAG: hypothetical protein ACHQFW_00625 [Chitinophagales bacterium]
MKQHLILLVMLALASNLSAQTGMVSLDDEISFTSQTVKRVADHLVNKNGFTLLDYDIPSTNTKEKADTTVYLSYNNDNGMGNEIRYGRKMNASSVSSGFSFTTINESWYKTETDKIAGLGFVLTDAELISETAHEAKIYSKENITIQTFWSKYPGSDQKFYTIDVIRF